MISVISCWQIPSEVILTLHESWRPCGAVTEGKQRGGAGRRGDHAEGAEPLKLVNTQPWALACDISRVSFLIQIRRVMFRHGGWSLSASPSPHSKKSHYCTFYHLLLPLVFLLLCSFFTLQGNYYGTPKPPAEPNLVQPDLVDQVLFDEDYGGEVPRKRTTSVSKMDRKDSAVPEEEDDDERPPLVNGLPGQ